MYGEMENNKGEKSCSAVFYNFLYLEKANVLNFY